MTTMIKPIREIYRVFRLLKFEGESLLTLFLILLTFLAYGTLPNRWYHILYVYSGSMEPTFAPGDLIVITPPPKVLEPGMVLTLNVDGQLVTHRLVSVNADGSLVTKGDINHVPDDWGNARVKIVGLYRFSIPYLGYLANLRTIFHPGTTGAWFNASDSIDFTVSTTNHEPATGTSIAASLSAGFNDNGSNLFVVGGKVCITNQGSTATTDLLISGQVEYNGNGTHGYIPATDGVFTLQPPDSLSPGETRCFSYDTMFTRIEGAHYRMAVTATITNHSGWLPGGPHCPGSALCPFGPTVRAEFDLPGCPSQPEEIFLIIPTPEPNLSPSRTPITPPEDNLSPSPSPTTLLEPSPSPFLTPDVTSELPALESPTSEPPTLESPTVEPPTLEPPTAEQPALEPPTAESPTEEPPTPEPPASELPIEEPIQEPAS